MSIQIHISPADSNDGPALASLYRWLARDSKVARHAKVTAESTTSDPGEMGSMFDIISAVFADGGAVAGVGSVFVAYRAWRDTRAQAPAFKIEKDGVTVILEKASDQELQRVLTLMMPTPNPSETAQTPTGEAEDR